MTVPILLLFSIVLVIHLINYRFKRITRKTDIQHLPESNLEPFPNDRKKIEIEDVESFIKEIVKKYSSYQDFIKSKDFDEFFTYWANHPKDLEKIRYDIEHKQTSFLKYKSIRY